LLVVPGIGAHAEDPRFARLTARCEGSGVELASVVGNGVNLLVVGRLWDAFRPDGLLTKRFDAKVCSRLLYGSDVADRLNSLPRACTHQLCVDTTKHPPCTHRHPTAPPIEGGTISTNHGALTDKCDLDALIIGERSKARQRFAAFQRFQPREPAFVAEGTLVG
jgi:hypothetical protein